MGLLFLILGVSTEGSSFLRVTGGYRPGKALPLEGDADMYFSVIALHLAASFSF